MMLGHNSVNVACRFLLHRVGKDVFDRELDNELHDELRDELDDELNTQLDSDYVDQAEWSFCL